MSAALIAACLWALIATLIGLAPRRFHWPGGIALIVTGLPLLVWVFVSDGPVPGVLLLAAQASVLRWPLRFLARRLLRIGRKAGG